MKETMQNVVLGFSGRIASGKSAISRAVADQLGIQRVSFGDYVRMVTRYMGLNESDRQVLQDVGKLYAEHPREFCSKLLEQVGYTRGQALVIDGIRHARIADELRIQVAPAELVLIYVEADEATIESRLSAGNSNERSINRLENDSTEAEVLTTLPLLADRKVKTNDGRSVMDVAQEIVDWIRQQSITERAAHSDERIMVSKFIYESLETEVQNLRQILLDTWLNDPSTKQGLKECADAAINALRSDLTLRVPRSPHLRTNEFYEWRSSWRDRLATAMQDEFALHFPVIASHLQPDLIREVVTEHLWPQVEAELLAFAIEGLALTWVRRHMGDATVLKHPYSEGTRWVVPLGIQGYAAAVGQVILDRDGNVIEENSSSRSELLAEING